MTPPGTAPRRGIHPVGLVLLAVVSVQFGGALAVTLLPLVGVPGSVALRLVLAALILLAVVRPRVRGRTRADWAVVGAFALALTAIGQRWPHRRRRSRVQPPLQPADASRLHPRRPR